MLEESTLGLPTVAGLLIAAVGWSGSLAAVYFGLLGRVTAGETRMNNFSQRLTEGSDKFAKFEEKFEQIQATHQDHGQRLVRLETMLEGMDGKLDAIVSAVRDK